MKVAKLIIWSFIACCMHVQCRNLSKVVRSDASHGQLAIRKTHIDGNGSVHFVVFGKGKTNEECRQNAAYLLIKQVIYEGIDAGETMKPLVSGGEFANEFRENEANYLYQLIHAEGVLSIGDQVQDKIVTSANKKEALSQMSFNVAVSPARLKDELTLIKNKNN